MIKALVIDDSAYNRVTITRMLEAHPHIKVIGTAVDGEDGIKQVLRMRPDVITLDLEMPVMDGFAFLRWVMANPPTPVIAVSSQSSDRSVFKALELGALDFIAKPGGAFSARLDEIENDLVAKVLQIADLRIDNLARRAREEETKDEPSDRDCGRCQGGVELVVIGASTGGPPALQHLFESLPKLPIAFVVAQHMPPTFTRLFAERVNRLERVRGEGGRGRRRREAGSRLHRAGRIADRSDATAPTALPSGVTGSTSRKTCTHRRSTLCSGARARRAVPPSSPWF